MSAPGSGRPIGMDDHLNPTPPTTTTTPVPAVSNSISFLTAQNLNGTGAGSALTPDRHQQQQQQQQQLPALPPTSDTVDGATNVSPLPTASQPNVDGSDRDPGLGQRRERERERERVDQSHLASQDLMSLAEHSRASDRSPFPPGTRSAGSSTPAATGRAQTRTPRPGVGGEPNGMLAGPGQAFGPLPSQVPSSSASSHSQNQSSSQGPARGGPPVDDANRPLNVTDALTYLDAVKVQFHDKPDVYNHFLDIMKDFKSQLLDTPGVIDRVSTLFQGNPYLIQGFNTFLPPGYRIECSADPNDNNITVITPMGTVIQSTRGFDPISRIPREPAAAVTTAAPTASQVHLHAPPAANFPGLTLHASRPTTPSFNFPFGQFPPQAPYSPGLIGPTNAAATFLGGLSSRNQVPTQEKSNPGEFNHAIQYLNKIKNRYANNPDKYKQFLEVLQTYQKEQRQLEDSQVFLRVQTLFKDAPDLMSEFKDFLPDAIGPQASGLIGILPQPTAGSSSSWPLHDGSGAPPVADKPEKKGGARRRKRPAEKDPTPTPAAKGPGGRAKRTKTQHKPEPKSPSFSPYQIPPSPPQPHAHTHAHAHGQPAAVAGASVQQLSHLHPAQAAAAAAAAAAAGGGSGSTPDELMFFDRAKKSLENREVYEEFLKLLKLFAQDIIDTRTLIERAEAFLGDGELLKQFKELMDWDTKAGEWDGGPPGSVRTSYPEVLAVRQTQDGQGPSYRRLPENEQRLACSGRDQLCRSVLNDEWVSHPTWASEDSGFIAHKKNAYEELLHKTEEERHEYHVQLLCMARTIGIIEPLNVRLEEMTSEERTQFKLKPGFGGPCRAIYERIIMHVYGRENGPEVIDALQNSPAAAVPVVLARLKKKQEEWRRSFREWSKAWRDADSRNLYKSLDCQHTFFKANDKKGITAKYFVSEIEGKKSEQKERLMNGASDRGSLGFQLEYSFEDAAVMTDCLRLIYHFLDHAQPQFSMQERRRLERFLETFVPVFCMNPTLHLGTAASWGPLDSADEEEDVNAGSRGGRRSAAGDGPSGGVVPGDLRKHLLKAVQGKASRRSTPSRSAVGSRAPSPGPGASRLQTTGDEGKCRSSDAEDVWVKEAVDSVPDGVAGVGRSHVKGRPFFANTTFYTLLRLLQLVYSRLARFKEIGTRHAASGHEELRANPIAVDLGLEEPQGPGSILAQILDTYGDNRGVNALYLYLLDACEKVFDNEMDAPTFEEHLRWFFGSDAYLLFTVDKLMIAVIKQVHTIVTDNKCQELWELLQKARSVEAPTTHDVIRYRREAECHVGSDDNLYRIEWETQFKKMSIQLVGAEDPSVDEDRTAFGRWREYVDTYVTRYATEWVPRRSPMRPPFLRRNLTNDEGALSTKAIVQNGIAVRISLGTYKVFYEARTEDFVFQRRTAEESKVLRERANARAEERKRCRILSA